MTDLAAALVEIRETGRSLRGDVTLACVPTVAVVPSLALQAGAYPKLRVIALTDPVITRTFVLLVRRSAHLTPAAKALHDMILARAGGQRSG